MGKSPISILTFKPENPVIIKWESVNIKPEEFYIIPLVNLISLPYIQEIKDCLEKIFIVVLPEKSKINDSEVLKAFKEFSEMSGGFSRIPKGEPINELLKYTKKLEGMIKFLYLIDPVSVDEAERLHSERLGL